MKILKHFLAYQTAATAIEYALVAGLIALVIITAVTNLGTSLKQKYADISANVR